MERFYIIAPALIPSAYMLSMFAYFCARSAVGRQPKVSGADRRKYSELIGPLLTSYFIWLIRPIERAFVSAGVSPNAITAVSMVSCVGSGVAAATGHLATAAWAYIFAGMLDVLDGRLARATNRSSQSGAFLDSVSDRWGELFVLSGFAWYLRDSAWLMAVLLAVAGSMMVSYTRARGEGLGLDLDGGTMQRAERILIISVGSIFAAWFQAGGAEYSMHIIGGAVALTGVGSAATSVGRWARGYKLLKEREREPAQPPGDSEQIVIASERGGPVAQPDSRAA